MSALTVADGYQDIAIEVRCDLNGYIYITATVDGGPNDGMPHRVPGMTSDEARKLAAELLSAADRIDDQ